MTTQKQDSQSFRRTRHNEFKPLSTGQYGGYRRGVVNGPAPTTDRGRRRVARRKEAS